MNNIKKIKEILSNEYKRGFADGKEFGNSISGEELVKISEKINAVYSYLSSGELNCEKVDVRNILRDEIFG